MWRCLYKPKEKNKKDAYDDKYEIVQELCEKHIQHQNILHAKKPFIDTTTDSKRTERFVRSLPHREVLKIATKKWRAADMNKFIIKPVQEQIEEKQPLEYLTEMREVTIQFINIVPKTSQVSKLVVLVDEAYQIVCNVVCSLLGVVNKVSLFDKDAMMLVFFGLRGVKHELESQNALTSAHRILKSISNLEGVKSVSVGITNGLVYCGVVGHPLRQEYTVIGGAVNKAARMMCAFQNKVTCDFKTFKNSKLASYYFQMQSVVQLKGIEDAGHIFEYNEDFEETVFAEDAGLPIIGRESELSFVAEVIKHEHVGDYSGLCFYGKQKIGKTKVLEAALFQSQKEGHSVASTSLSSSCLRSYFCISTLYKNLYDSKARSGSKDHSFLKSLPSELWNFNELLQRPRFDFANKKNKMIEFFKELCLCHHKDKVTVLFVDNIQYIDTKSLEIIDALLKTKSVRFFSAGHFEEDTWDVQWKISLSEYIKMLEMDPMDSEDIPALTCQFLRTRGAPLKLISLLTKSCEGRPGWIQSCVLRLVNNGCLEIKIVTEEDCTNNTHVFPELKLLNQHQQIQTVAHLSDKFKEQTEELTLAAISLDLFDSFAPYQQLVIKTGAVIGEIFSRSLLYVMLKYPNEQVFADTIMKLYEEEVLDCGTRYVNSGGLVVKKLCCRCFLEDEDYLSCRRRSVELPKYAFCKLLHFKNKSLRAVAYDLLPANQKKELHSRITDVLENQNNSCPNCLRDDAAAIINLRTFKQMMQYSVDPQAKYAPVPQSDFDFYRPTDIEQIIREKIKEKPAEGSDDEVRIRKSVPKFKRKIWDPTTCFCLEILTRVYADLIYHSEQAKHLGKRIFYLMQYGVVLITLHEYKDAIPILTESSELCMIDADHPSAVVNASFRKLHMGKIHMLLAAANFRLGDVASAKVHLMISLRQYNVPMLALTYKIPHLFLNRPAVFNKIRLPQSRCHGAQTMLNTDFGICMNILSNVFAAEGQWELAKKASERSIYLLQYANANISLLCEAYTKAIELYNMFGDGHTCERLERCISRDVLRSYTGNVIMELYAICKLVAVIFEIRMMHGLISRAIRTGYRAMDLNATIQAYYIQSEIMPIMASALLLAQKIENAVSVIKLLFNIGKTMDESVLVDYYAFCVELNVETSFLLEPIDRCEEFAEVHFEKQMNKSTYNESENKMMVFLHVHHLRNGRWSDALRWKTMMRLEKNEVSSIFSVTNLLKYTESLLITLVWNISMKKTFLNLEEKRIEAHLRQCAVAAKKWRLFMPRYLHYMAYYSRIKERKRLSENYLKRALKMAKAQGNALEACWVRQSRSTWNGGLNFGNDVKDVDWRCARSYDEVQWSQIMYALPCDL